MNRKIKIVAGIQIAAFGLLAASALGLTSTLASPAHSGQDHGTVGAYTIIHKPFKSH